MIDYIVIELQTASTGQVGNIVTTYEDLNDAESHYYAVLSAAAISSIARHAAVLLDSEGAVLESRCFSHDEEPITGGGE